MAYQLDHEWQTEHERLTRIGAILDPVTIGCLETIGVTTGWRCLEVGAGAGSIATWLCRRVGAHGQVVATDLEVKFLTVLDSPNLEIRQHDIVHDPLEPAAFDLVHARCVLEHLPGREAALTKMVKALKPGGWLLVEDTDYVSFLPVARDQTAMFERAWWQFFAPLRQAGWAPYYARTHSATLRRHGLRDAQCVGRVFEWGGVRPATAQWLFAFQRFRDRTVEAGLLSQQEADAFLALLETPEFTAWSPIIFSAWGRVPENA
jgi:SAM-dependent methyltransferase